MFQISIQYLESKCVNLGMTLVLFSAHHISDASGYPGTGYPRLLFNLRQQNDAARNLKRDEILGPVEYEINILKSFYKTTEIKTIHPAQNTKGIARQAFESVGLEIPGPWSIVYGRLTTER
jgi:hypothetical protein